MDPKGHKECNAPCECADGKLKKDAFGNECCEPGCDLAMVVDAPCRSVQSQILANVLVGNPPEQGITTGHAFISGKCSKRATFGFYPGPGAVFPTLNPVLGIVKDNSQHTWTHAEEIGPMCKCSMDCVEEKKKLIENKNPPY
jgi:hypothetical protein